MRFRKSNRNSFREEIMHTPVKGGVILLEYVKEPGKKLVHRVSSPGRKDFKSISYEKAGREFLSRWRARKG